MPQVQNARISNSTLLVAAPHTSMVTSHPSDVRQHCHRVQMKALFTRVNLIRVAVERWGEQQCTKFAANARRTASIGPFHGHGMSCVRCSIILSRQNADYNACYRFARVRREEQRGFHGHDRAKRGA